MRLDVQSAGRAWGSRVALDAVSLSLEAGERVALIGPSGSGKSTLLRLVTGGLEPSTGRVLADDADLASLSARSLRRHRARCGIVEQGGKLVPQLSVHRNVIAGRLPHWPTWKTLLSALWPLERDRAAALLDRVGLADRQWDRTSILSGGQQQRVGIARALAGEPELICADEPTASLDPTTAADMANLLLDVCAERGAGLVFCTHWVSLVTRRVDRVIGLREGRLVLDEPSDRVTDAHLDALYAGSGERH